MHLQSIAVIPQSLRTLNVPHHIQELVRAPRRRFFRQLLNRRLLRWAGHVTRMPTDLPADDLGCTLNKELKSYDLPTGFGQWSALAADRRVWQQWISVQPPCSRPATTLIHDKWRKLFGGLT
jgi:hypothetical protein